MKNLQLNSAEIQEKGLRHVLLVLSINGTFSKENALFVEKDWARTFAESPNVPKILVWDCLEMEGYDAMARSIFQKFLSANMKQIKQVYLITESPTIKAGAKIISLFTSLSIKVLAESPYSEYIPVDVV